ncbi:uncharacterized protein LOC115363194 [Myripristis murdjan]|uniref:uncharacterized protein LOC115363194 n=1 Tax=Myripristis murdjan TaxID=586833 RepID=UPI001175D03A|nr:uncharacterized protein LOC115363194 [Myripristis murdjan]
MAAHIPPIPWQQKSLSTGKQKTNKQTKTLEKKNKQQNEQKKRKKEGKKTRMDESVSFLFIVAVLFLCLIFFFYNPFFFLPLSLFSCTFIFKNGNTKLPETAQFTQAPQSTTAFNSANRSSFTQPAGKPRHRSLAPTGRFLLPVPQPAASCPPLCPLIVAVALSGMDVYTGKLGLMYVGHLGSTVCCLTHTHTHTHTHRHTHCARKQETAGSSPYRTGESVKSKIKVTRIMHTCCHTHTHTHTHTYQGSYARLKKKNEKKAEFGRFSLITAAHAQKKTSLRRAHTQVIKKKKKKNKSLRIQKKKKKLKL